jgi:hypothetical protein
LGCICSPPAARAVLRPVSSDETEASRQRAGVDFGPNKFGAHFDHPGEILPAAKAGIQPEDRPNGAGIGSILVLQLIQALAEVLFPLPSFCPLCLTQLPLPLQLGQWLLQTEATSLEDAWLVAQLCQLAERPFFATLRLIFSLQFCQLCRMGLDLLVDLRQLIQSPAHSLLAFFETLLPSPALLDLRFESLGE